MTTARDYAAVKGDISSHRLDWREKPREILKGDFEDYPRVQYKGVDSAKPKLNRDEKRDFSKKSTDLHFKQLEDGARALKRGSENARDKLAEQRFYRLELLARRRHSKTRLWEKILSFGYQWSSDFGASMVRPLVTIFWLWLIFGFVYFHWYPAHVVEEAVNTHTLTDALIFSARAVFRPFSYWAYDELSPASFEQVLLFGHDALQQLLIRLVATLQSFLSLVLVFLTALSARRYFQLS